MSATLLDGKKLAAEMRAEIARQVADLKADRGVTPGLGVILIGTDPASTSYVTAKERACEEAGADALSMINTITGMAIDLNRRRPVLANITGGLSGPAVKPIALRMVWQVAKAVRIPIIGMGGITSGTDALEFMLAGATAIQVGTSNFVTPNAAEQIAEEMESWLVEHGVKDVKELIGALQT